MLLPRPSDAIHKAWLFRLLMHIADDEFLKSVLRFKGGTCASILGWLDRFSVDLDFDLIVPAEQSKAKKHLEKIFSTLGLEIKDRSAIVPQYFLKYSALVGQRNTIKLEALFPVPLANDYEAVRLVDIDRIMMCQTQPTMVANKLVTLIDRHQKNGSIAARDLYDIHYFLMHGFSYKPAVIEERRKQPVSQFFNELINFIDYHVTDKILCEDLNYLLPKSALNQVRKTIKQETMMLLRDAKTRIEKTR